MDVFYSILYSHPKAITIKIINTKYHGFGLVYTLRIKCWACPVDYTVAAIVCVWMANVKVMK
jgi:hypothetical protein